MSKRLSEAQIQALLGAKEMEDSRDIHLELLNGWFRPMHHECAHFIVKSNTCISLVKRGLLKSRIAFTDRYGKPKYEYHITRKGREALTH